MFQARKSCLILLGGFLTVVGCNTPVQMGGHAVSPPAMTPLALVLPAAPTSADVPDLPIVPALQPDDRPLPINLPSALQLANVRAVDVAAAAERMRVSAAVLEQAQVLWLPTVTFGADYLYHAGPIQDVSNTVFNDSHSGLMVGGGSGIGNAAVISVTDAIFAPLAARRQVQARQADRQAASNDTLVAVSEAYFTVQQARGEDAGAIEVLRQTENLITRTRKLAPEILPDLELYRVETERASRQKTELLARERWKVASAELLRLLRMDPAARVEPLEPPQLLVELIDLKKPVIDLIPVALTNRPELASQQSSRCRQRSRCSKQEKHGGRSCPTSCCAGLLDVARSGTARQWRMVMRPRHSNSSLTNSLSARRHGSATAVAARQPWLWERREDAPAASRESRGDHRFVAHRGPSGCRGGASSYSGSIRR